MKCPYCGSLNVERDEVDNGVGIQATGPHGCLDCHAVELDPESTPRDDDERRTGWVR